MTIRPLRPNLARSLAATTVLALGLGACAPVETSSRNVSLDTPLLGASAQVATRDYTLTEVRATASRDLRVSERNGYYPFAQIVWRGDPIGDRYAQIETLFETAGARAATDLVGARPVVALVQVARFHGVTERTRYSVGGVYNVEFQLSIVDAETGEVIEAPRMITANLPAPGGEAAVRLEQSGQTERVRILDFLTFVLTREIGPARAPGAPEPLDI